MRAAGAARWAAALAGAFVLSTAAVPATRVVKRYPDGSVEWERHYVRGREEGVSLGWWEDGTPHFRYVFADGLLEGEALEWYPDGTLYRDFHYAAGKESGSQRMWYPDGTLRANYVVVDGRRYGRIGSKGCTGGDRAEAS